MRTSVSGIGPLPSLALHSLWHRRGSVLLTVATIALSVALLLGVERLASESRRSFASTVAGTDLLIGARSGPVNLLLYAIFHVGDATNNVSWQSYREIARMPEVAWTIPISLGDSHRGFRVMGTTPDFFAHYRYGDRRPLAFAAGGAVADVYDAVLGARVAAKLHYGLGRKIVLTHGTGVGALMSHADKPFRVVGILAPTGTPVDDTVVVGLDGIEAIHIDWHAGVRLPGAEIDATQARLADLTPKTITAFLVGLHSRMSVFAVQRAVDDYEDEPLLAVLPGVALQQLWSLVGVAENALRAISAMVVAVGLCGMLAALLTMLGERRREMAILRAVGARPMAIFGLLVAEAGMLGLAGIVVGVILLYIGMAFARPLFASMAGIELSLSAPSALEWALLGAVLLASLLAGCIPAWIAYRRNLADGLQVRL
jgi:putative ABC transport system permease protein